MSTAESPVAEVAADGKQSFSAIAKLGHPALWSPDEPNLYCAIATVETGGNTRDRDKAVFGVRTLTFDANRGFLLNSKSTPIQGTCNHQDHAGVGAALPDSLHAFRAGVLKAMSCNAMHTSHNMPTPQSGLRLARGRDFYRCSARRA